MQLLLSKYLCHAWCRISFRTHKPEMVHKVPRENFNLSYESRPGRPSDCNGEATRGPLSKNARQSTSELAKTLGIPNSTAHYNLKKWAW